MCERIVKHIYSNPFYNYLFGFFVGATFMFAILTK